MASGRSNNWKNLLGLTFHINETNQANEVTKDLAAFERLWMFYLISETGESHQQRDWWDSDCNWGCPALRAGGTPISSEPFFSQTAPTLRQSANWLHIGMKPPYGGPLLVASSSSCLLSSSSFFFFFSRWNLHTCILQNGFLHHTVGFIVVFYFVCRWDLHTC